jgi:hypothetical protein
MAAPAVTGGQRWLAGWGPWFGAAVAVALSVLGAAQLRQDQHLIPGLLCFLGAALFLRVFGDSEAEGLKDLPSAAAPRQAWEPIFVVGLVVAGYFQFIHGLWDLTPGAIYSEHTHINSALTIEHGPYRAVDPAFAYWPTMYQYLGLAATKVFGYSPGSFHLPSAIVAWITLLAFYFAARAITSPVSAAGATLLWLGFHYNIELSQRSYPVGLMFLPPLLMLGCIAWALRSHSRWPWAGVGFSAALGLWGYYPGRLMPFILAVISGWLWLNRKRFALPPKAFRTMWLVFILSFSPVLVSSLRNFHAYWAYGQNNNPLMQVSPGVNPLKGLEHVIEYNLVPYMKMYHFRANPDAYEDDSLGRPILDRFAQVLFPLGLMLCLFTLFRAPSAYLWMVLVLGTLPALLIEMGQPPWARRAALSFPAVFLFCAVALEQLRQSLSAGRWRLPNWIWMAALLVMGLVSVKQGVEHYRDYIREPVVRQFMRHSGDLLRREILAHPGYQVIASDRVLEQGESGVMPPNVSPGMKGGYWIEDFVFLSPGKPTLLAMGPYLEHAVPLVQAIYPSAQVKVFRQEEESKWDWTLLYRDFFNPQVYLVSILVSEKDIAERVGLLDLSRSKAAAVDIQSPSFAADHQQAALHLGGTLKVDLPGMTMTAQAAWPGWQVKVDGRVLRPGKDTFIEGGPRSIELVGRVPANAKGAIGVALTSGGVDLLRPGRCLAWRFDHGLEAAWWPGTATWGKGQPVLHSHFLTPVFRFNRPTLNGFNSLRVSATLRVPADGSYGFRLEQPSAEGRVRVDGKIVWDNISQPGMPLAEAQLQLSAKQPHRLEVDFQRTPVDETYQIFALSVNDPVTKKWGSLPYDWCSPAAGSR